MTNPNDPNQGGWNPGAQGQGGGSAWNDFGRQEAPPAQSYGPQQPTQSFGQQPPPTQAFGWQPQHPQGQPGQQPPGGMPPGPPYGPPPQGWGPSGPGGEPPRSRAGLWIALAVVALLVAGGLTTWLVLRNKDTTADPGPSTPLTSQSAPSAPSSDRTTTGTTATGTTTTGTTATDTTTSNDQTTDSTTDEATTDETTTDDQTTDETTTDETTTDETTTDETTTDETTTDEQTTEETTTAAKTTAPAPSVAVGDCIQVVNAKRVVISQSVVSCDNPAAVYQVTDIVVTKTQCDPSEANLPGTSGGLPNKILCLLATLKKGECWRAKGASNGDYERIDCAKAKPSDNKVVFESRTNADPAQCPKGSKSLSYAKRKVLFCYAPAS